MSRGQTTYVLQVEGDPIQQMASIERAILKLDSKITVESITFDEVYETATFAQKLPMVMTVLFCRSLCFYPVLGCMGSLALP